MIYISVKSITIEENKNNLKQTIALISANLSDIEHLPKEVNLRVTMIDLDGVVIYENDKDKSQMDNHANRAELVQAGSEEYGHSVRYSTSMKTDYLYVAKKTLYNHQEIYLRLAMPLTTVMNSINELMIKMFLLFVVVLVVSYLIARSMSHKVLYDIKQLKSFLEEIGSKNYEAIVHIKYIYEFLELSLILKNIIKRLQKKDKKK